MSFEFESARHGGARYFRSLGIVGFAAAFTLVVAVAAPANAKVMPCGDLASGSPGSCVHPLVVPLGSRFTRSGPRAPVPLAENSALWVENGFILANANTNDAFGTATAISGDTAIVGAPGVNGDGAAFVLSREQGVWTGDVEFTASDLTGGADFGAAVAIDGNTAVVGAPDADVGGNSLQGKVYVFERSGGVWTGTAELTASDGALYDFFGQTVAVSGSSIIVGSVPAADDEMGRAYIFDRSGNTWVQSAELTATDEGNYDSFGDAVALDGTTALIGAKTVNLYQGAAYVFSENNGVWSQSAKLTGDPSQPN